MNGCRAGYRSFVCGFLQVGLVAALVSCAQSATPTIALRPTPDALDIYFMMMERYTSPSAIAGIYDMSADDASRMLRALESIEAPPELRSRHEQAANAYQHICAGKLLLPGADNVLRSEAYFVIDWGIALLEDCREHLDERRD